ncbi:MAG TPA: hydrolase [Acidobacteria bacterium]|nr:hydrolase [Acidobacteriota bacterium]
MERLAAVLLVVVTGIGLEVSVAAQSFEDGNGSGKETLSDAIAESIDDGPVIDGQVLEDPIWIAIAPVTGFTQTTPEEGAPASERTEVRIAYSTDTLFFGVICYDSDPSTIIVSDSRRDSPLSETDSFQIILDTYLDQQNGFVFGTNPSGLEYDGQVTNEGQGTGRFGGGSGGGGGRQQQGSGQGLNINWDGSWEVRTQITDFGWSAEFAIPFRTLRYSQETLQIWGLNFQRNIRKRNERVFWSPLPRQYNLYRLSMAGRLTQLQVPPQRNLNIVPYLLGDAARSAGATNGTPIVGDVGIDVKYSVTPSLTLDATYNTDFAQVEVDDQQINLDRFNLFFPEKRPFFLENAGLFGVGNAGTTELFFSRRIGIGPNGMALPILGGARLSGQVGGNVNVGLLSMQTEEVSGVAPSNNFTVARIRKDLPNRSNVGAILVSRQASGDLAKSDDYNRAFGIDGRWGIGQNTTINGFAARTETPGLVGLNHAYSLRYVYNSQAWQHDYSYSEVGKNFNPEVGFLRRTNYRNFNGRVNYTFRLGPDAPLNLHELRPHVSSNFFWDFNGFLESSRTHIDNHWEFKNGTEIHSGINLTTEGVTEAFKIMPSVVVPPGTYDHQEIQLVVMTNQGSALSGQLYSWVGGAFGGERVMIRSSVRYRVGDSFNTEFSLSRNAYDLPGGKFVTNLMMVRTSYSFTPRVFIQSLLQYNDKADLWSSNLRLGILGQANTGLFLVYNDTHGLGGFSPAAAGRSLTLKYSHFFDVFR